MSFLTLVAVLGAMWLHDGATPASPHCTCPEARLSGGWCEPHGVGYVASVRIPSRQLYDTLDAHGHTLDLSTFTCEECRKAIETGGFCGKDRIGFVRGQAYFSRLTYELARGERKAAGAVSCPVCRKNAGRLGWCDRCGIGMIGHVAMSDRPGYEAAARAVGILRTAVKTTRRCASCAVAMITDTQCPSCRISYEDGRPLPRSP